MLRVALLCMLLALSACTTYQGARLFRSGTAALDGGDSARAVHELERAAQLLPDASEIQNHLGLAYQARGREADALRAFERALALDCDNQAAKQNLRVAKARAELAR